MSKHTPGPWRSKPTVGSDFIYCTILGAGQSGAVARHVSQDDAPLIAASPDLADVAHMVLTTATVYTPPELVKAATDALKKAGEL